jgi:FtsP/CotA-like multicopper oxidase with cupredoxin domain
VTQTAVVVMAGVRRRAGVVLVVAVAFGGAAHVPGVMPDPGLPGAEAAGATATVADTTATITISVGGIVSGYSPKSVTLEQGGVLTVVNNDSMVHTVTSVAVDADGDPLFDVSVGPRQTGRLVVPADLAAGKYSFYCRFHPNMRGTLVVTGEGGGLPAPPTFEQALRIPEVLTGRDITIPMKRAQVRVMPHGPKTWMWTYGGTFPGPTIKRPTGSTTKVTFVNDLPRGAGSMTVHQHGGHQRSEDDGQPTRYLIAHGASRTYTYPLRNAGRPLPAAFRFYHDHRMDRTAENNWRGLQGMFLVTDRRERRLGLPHGAYDVPLHITDRSLTADNQLTDPFPAHHGMHDWMTGPTAPPNDATVGKRILVNGQFAPYLTVKPGRYRLRMLNAATFSAYDLALSNGRPFTQIGTGNALLPRSVERPDILLGPAQRADVVVDFSGLEGQDVILSTVPRTDTTDGTGSRSAAIMQFRVRGTAHQDSRVPKRLRAVPALDVPKKVSKVWTFGLTQDGHGSFWSINGRMFDPERVDYRVRQGTTERWRLRNTSDMTHYVHLHEEEWRTVSRDGKPPPPWERGFEDTWRLDPGEYVDVAATFTDFPGVFMLHCHMLDHEDHGMMAQFEVTSRRS